MSRSRVMLLPGRDGPSVSVDPVGSPPVIEGVPTISGDTGLGDTLTFTPASVTGTPTPTRTWQVYRDAAPVGSPQAGNTYVIVEADLGADFSVQQIETNSEGTDTATSAATSIPGGLATAMRVRESVGNSEADIPLAVDGYVDETALTTHTGAASGFVTNWHDQSGNDNDATQVTQTAQPRIVNAGTVDEALVFDGTNDFLTLTTPLSFAGEFTLACWAKRSSTNTPDTIFGHSATAKFIFSPNNTQIALRAIDGGAASTYLHGVDSTQWNHFAVTRDVNNKVDGYVNGVRVGRLFSDAAQVGTGTYSRIGNDDSSLFLHGSLDQLYAANVALSEAQIAALMNGTLPASGTVLYLKAKDVAP